MRKYYQRRLPENPIEDYYFIHRDTENVQSLIIEYGFIDNESDRQKLRKNLLDYGEAVVRAISQYIGINYVPPANLTNDYYTVQSGDTLYKISQRFGLTVNELKSLNNLTSDTLSIGQILKVSTENIQPPINDQNSNIYIVQAGDSLYSIAQRFNTTVNQLIVLNNLATTSIQIGQQLIIRQLTSPPSPPPEQYYIVQSGDTLYKIAQQFNVLVDDIIQANQLTTTVLSIGQSLLIPTLPSTPPNNLEYIVQSGDSLWNIAKKFNVTIDDIKRLNNLNSNLIQLGQILIIPFNQSIGYITYTVKLNDSLYKIAQAYNTTVDEIKKLNNLTSNVLPIGQQLQIPVN